MGDFKIAGYSIKKKSVFSFAAAFILWAAGLALQHFSDLSGTVSLGAFTLPLRFLPLAPFMLSWFLAGFPVLKDAVKSLLKGRGLDENFLMSIATVGAFAIGEWEEAAGVMIFYMIGELIEEAAISRSQSSIDALLALKPDRARIKTGDGWTEVPASDVSPGTLVLVRAGERIPLDGIVVEGESSIDSSMLTGESKPETCVSGSEVRSGTVSLNGVLRVKTTKSANDSSAAKIIKLVEYAKEAKAKPERFITAFAKWYTPLIVGIAFLIAAVPPLFIEGAVFSDWLYRGLILLVISCPCALVVSIPLGYFAGIGGMSRRGIMVKGAVHLDSLKQAKNVALDKTGTLTKGSFSIVKIEPEAGISEDLLLETAALAEKESNHPIAKAILESAKRSGMAEELTAPDYSEIAGQGIEAVFENTRILAGNRRLLENRGIFPRQTDWPVTAEESLTRVYIARGGKYMGRILIGDTLKEGAAEAVSRLKKMGVNLSMFTGDTRSSALEAASRLGIDSVEAELLPEDKLDKVEKLAVSGTTVFVGDGINDSPVLARSHVGIAMGSGADVAVEAADVIIMTDDPVRIPETIERAKKTHRIVMGNMAFALGAKGIFIVMAGLGMANMWLALIADVGVALIAILNSTRALR